MLSVYNMHNAYMQCIPLKWIFNIQYKSNVVQTFRFLTSSKMSFYHPTNKLGVGKDYKEKKRKSQNLDNSILNSPFFPLWIFSATLKLRKNYNDISSRHSLAVLISEFSVFYTPSYQGFVYTIITWLFTLLSHSLCEIITTKQR